MTKLHIMAPRLYGPDGIWSRLNPYDRALVNVMAGFITSTSVANMTWVVHDLEVVAYGRRFNVPPSQAREVYWLEAHQQESGKP